MKSRRNIWKDRSPRTVRLLKLAVGKATTGCALHEAGRTYFPSWEAALENAGVDPNIIRRHSFWNRENIVQAIQALEKKHVSLSPCRITQDCSIRTKRILQRTIAQPRTGRSLAGAAWRIYGSWDRALHAAGIDPESVRIRTFRWDKRVIGRLLRALKAANVPLDEKKFSRDNSERTGSIIFAITGRKTRGIWIHQLARWKFGSWNKALEYAFQESQSKADLEEAREEAKDNLALYIRRLYDQGFNVNYKAMIRNSDSILTFNQAAFGEDISGKSLIWAATRHLGSWDNALEAAQLDPLEIRRRMRSHTSNISVVSHQVERVSIGNGVVRNIALIGDAPKDPGEILEHKEVAESLKEAIDELDDEDREVAEEVFDVVLQVRRFKDQAELIKLVVQLSNGSLNEHRVRTILKKLAQSTAFGTH